MWIICKMECFWKWLFLVSANFSQLWIWNTLNAWVFSLSLSEHIIYVDGISTTMQKVPLIFSPSSSFSFFPCQYGHNYGTGRVYIAKWNNSKTTVKMDNNQNAARIPISTRLVCPTIKRFTALSERILLLFFLLVHSLIRFLFCNVHTKRERKTIFCWQKAYYDSKADFLFCFFSFLHLIQHLIGNYYILTAWSFQMWKRDSGD